MIDSIITASLNLERTRTNECGNIRVSVERKPILKLEVAGN